MRLIAGTLTAVGLMIAAPAVAQAQAGINVGMQVTDANGGPVGTVTAIKGDSLLVKTDKHQALLPTASFRASGGKLLVGMTQAQLDAEIEKNLAAASASIAAGATVKRVSGAQVGTIDSIADGNATMTLTSGKKIAVPLEGLRGNPDGTVTIGYSAQQLQALVEGGSPAAAASSSDSADSSGK